MREIAALGAALRFWLAVWHTRRGMRHLDRVDDLLDRRAPIVRRSDVLSSVAAGGFAIVALLLRH